MDVGDSGEVGELGGEFDGRDTRIGFLERRNAGWEGWWESDD